MKITIGSDHAGVDYKSEVVEFLEKEKHEVLDVGTFSQESVDYPEFAHLVSKEVLAGADFGVLICDNLDPPIIIVYGLWADLKNAAYFFNTIQLAIKIQIKIKSIPIQFYHIY